MSPIIELLIQDLEDENEDIENINHSEYERVLSTYESYFSRCIKLKEEDFSNKDNYERIMSNIKMIYNTDFMLLNALRNKLDSASILNFHEIRKTFKVFSALLKSDV